MPFSNSFGIVITVAEVHVSTPQSSLFVDVDFLDNEQEGYAIEGNSGTGRKPRARIEPFLMTLLILHKTYFLSIYIPVTSILICQKTLYVK